MKRIVRRVRRKAKRISKPHQPAIQNFFGKHQSKKRKTFLFDLSDRIECLFRGKIKKKNRKMNVWYDDVPSLHS